MSVTASVSSRSFNYFIVFDLLVVLLSSLLSHYLVIGDFDMHDRYMIATAVISVSVMLLNLSTGRSYIGSFQSTFGLIKKVSFTWFFSGSITVALIFFLDESAYFDRKWLLVSLLSSYFLALLIRLFSRGLYWYTRANGKKRRSVFMIGDNNSIVSLGRLMKEYQAEGYAIGGVQRIRHKNDAYDLIDIADRVRSSGATEVWITLSLDMGGIVRSIMYALRNETVEVRYFPDLKDVRLLNHRVSEVVGRYAIDLSVTPMSGQARVLKRIEDLVIGSMILLLISPICIGIACAVKFTSKGPILFKQARTGANGQEVKVYKFRSMKVHQEKAGQVTQATKNDSRLTPIGGFLRRTSLDELPQFINVLQGRMSIVGPRPHALAHNEYYKDLVESYMRRHMVKPGITGWAQVNGYRGETDTLDKMKKRVEYDLWYIDNWSLWLDIKIIIATVFKGFINKNAY